MICAARPRRSPTRCASSPTPTSTTTAGSGSAWRSKARSARTAGTCSPPGPRPRSKDVPEFTAKTWASLKPERIGAGTIYHHALAGGWNPDPALVLNGGILVNGRHPARALLERLTAPAAAAARQHAATAPAHAGRPAHVPARRRARAPGRLHPGERRAAAADPRHRRQPLRAGRAHGPQVPDPDQPPDQPLRGRHGRQRRRQGPRPQRHQGGVHRRRACSATSAATASPPARACSPRSTASPPACSSSTSSGSSSATSSTSAMRRSTSPRSGTC